MIYCLHGFGGRTSDFNFISKKHINIDLYHLKKYSIAELMQQIDLSQQNHVLIGYSMGARLAAQMFLQSPKHFSKIHLLASHMGLQTETERSQRKSIEKTIFDKVKDLSESEFNKYWNSLELIQPLVMEVN